MTIKVSTNSILKIACYVSLFIFALPFVDYFCPWYINMIPIGMVVLVALTSRKGRSNMIQIAFFAVVLCVFDWYFLHRQDEFALRMVNQMIALMPIVIAGQLDCNIIEKKFFKHYLQMGVILMSITSITTYIGLIMYPFASRELATGSNDEYTLMNIGGYEYIYSLVLMIPIVWWLIKNTKGVWKIVNMIALITYILCVYQSQYTFAVIGIVIAFILIIAQHKPKLALGIGCAMVSFVLLNGLGGIASIFRTISEWIPLEYVADRLLQAAQLLSGEKISTETSAERVVVMAQAIESFKGKPIFGWNWDIFYKDKLSGHSYVLDFLAGAGIFGGVFLGFVYGRFFRLGVAYKGVKIPSCVICGWILFALTALVNPVVFFLNFTVLFVFGMCVRKLQEAEN